MTPSGLWKIERRVVGGQGQVGLVVRLDGAEVFPVAVEQMGLDVMRVDAAREDFLAEVGGQRRGVEQVEQGVRA